MHDLLKMLPKSVRGTAERMPNSVFVKQSSLPEVAAVVHKVAHHLSLSLQNGLIIAVACLTF
jgi:hypothetical protein